jgi:hypothetical protein
MSGSAIVAWSGGCSEEVEQPQGSGVEIQYCALRVARSLIHSLCQQRSPLQLHGMHKSPVLIFSAGLILRRDFRKQYKKFKQAGQLHRAGFCSNV